MGKSSLIRLIIRKARNKAYLAPWRVRKVGAIPGYGAPTAENLGKWRDAFNQSLLPGGSNEHLGTAYWLQCNLEIFNQVTGEVVATYQAPAFEVIPSQAKNWTGVEHTPALGTVKNFGV